MWNNDSCALGVVADKRVMEIYGINHLGTVMLHGWFDYEVGLALLARRAPSCIIAAEENSLPSDFIDELRSIGHAVMITPSSLDRRTSVRSAKTLCERGMHWVNNEGGFTAGVFQAPSHESLYLPC